LFVILLDTKNQENFLKPYCFEIWPSFLKWSPMLVIHMLKNPVKMITISKHITFVIL